MAFTCRSWNSRFCCLQASSFPSCDSASAPLSCLVSSYAACKMRQQMRLLSTCSDCHDEPCLNRMDTLLHRVSPATLPVQSCAEPPPQPERSGCFAAAVPAQTTACHAAPARWPLPAAAGSAASHTLHTHIQRLRLAKSPDNAPGCIHNNVNTLIPVPRHFLL